MTVLRIVCLGFLAIILGAAELTVGSGKMYATPSLAAAAANHGDTISIDAGTYTNDVCTWTKNNLILRGVGGMARLPVGYNVVAGGKAIWVLSGSNITVQNIEFSGAAIPSGMGLNAAGIRAEGTGLTVTACYFHDNQNGILCGANASSDILIENSEFAYNGAGDGLTHNLYIGAIRKLTFRYNYSHHAKVGHNLKSRALANTIIGNRIMDEAAGTSSYVIDLPNGGLTFLIGNLIQQGPLSSNRSVIVNYAEEGVNAGSQHLYVFNNTIVNDYTGAGGTNFLNIAATTTVARVENNIFLGQGTAIGGTATSNLHNLVTTTSPLVNRAGYDYRLAGGAAAINAAVDPGSADGQALLPTSQYVHPKSSQARTTSGAAPDIGAYEYVAANVAPVITEGATTTMTVNEDVAGAKTLNATDANGDTLTWSILTQGSKGVAAVSGTGATKSVGYTPTANLNGADSFVVQVADGMGGFDTITVSVTITAVNDAPVLASAIPDRSATVAVAFSYTVPIGTFTDIEGTTLTWTSNEALGWLGFNATTRTFSGTPAAGDVAATTITVTASDGSLSASDSFVLTVSAVANAVPVVASASAAPATVAGTSTALSCSASDDGGEPNLTYTWSATGPAAVTYSRNGTNAAKTATATFTRAGAYVFTVSARDAGGLTGTRTVNVSVTATPTTLAATPATATVAVGAQAMFSASVSDQFGVLLAAQPTVTWSVSGGGAIDASGRFTAGATAGGPWTVTATAGALSDTSQVSVTATVAGGGGASSEGGGSSGGGCGAGAIGLLLALPLACVGRRRRSDLAR
jgi:hypothetical protein